MIGIFQAWLVHVFPTFTSIHGFLHACISYIYPPFSNSHLWAADAAGRPFFFGFFSFEPYPRLRSFPKASPSSKSAATRTSAEVYN